LGSVRKAVQNNHLNLDTFGRVLQQLTAGNEKVGQDIFKDYCKAFPDTSDSQSKQLEYYQ
jgi:predicted nucleotidyltransferase